MRYSMSGIVLVMLAAVQGASAQGRNPELEFTVFELAAGQDAVRIPVLGADADRFPRLRVASVRLGDQHNEAQRQALEAGWVQLDSGDSEIELKVVRRVPLRTQGVYEVTLRLRGANDDEDATTLRLSLRIPAAGLSVPSRLQIDREIRVPGIWAVQSVTPLRLRETSRKSAAHVEFSQKLTTTENLFPQGYLDFETTSADAVEIPAGQEKTVAYRAEGDLPLGTVPGELTLRAPEIPNEVTLPFQVRTRLSRFYIVLLLAAGLGLSFLTKKRWKKSLERADAEASAADLVKQADRALDRHKDAKFAELVEKARNPLRDALQGSSADIDELVSDLEKVLEEAQKDLVTRREDVRQDLAGASQVLTYPRELPESIELQLSRLREKVDEVNSLLSVDNISAVENDYPHLTTDAVEDVRLAVLDWKGDVKALVETLLAVDQPGLTKEMRESFQEATRVPLEALDKIGFEGLESLDQATGALKSCSGIRHGMDAALRPLALSIDKLVRDARTALREEGVEPRKVEELVNRAAALRGMLATAADQPGEAVQQAGELLNGFHQAWQAVLAEAGVGAAVKAAKESEYSTALVRLREEPAIQKEVLRKSQGYSVKLSPSGEGGPTEGTEPSESDAASVWVDRVKRMTLKIPTPPSTEEIKQRALARKESIQQWQAVAAGVLIGAVGYATFQADFIGTWDDILAIFSWAYGLDLTVAAALAKIKN